MNTIKAILLLTTIITVPMTFSDASAQNAKLFPDWFNNNLKWYLDGAISESELASAFEHLVNQNIIFLNPERAKMVQELKDENMQLRQQMKGMPPPNPAPKGLPELPQLPDASCPSGYDWIQCAQVCIPSRDMVCPSGMSINPNTGRCMPHDDQKPCICTKEYLPVCGADGNTYGNKCQANCAEVDVSYVGECQNKCASNDQCESGTVCRDGLCQKPCEVQCIAPDPVCGVDGNTYVCGKADAACHGVDVAHDGECKQVCPQVYTPVCGVDGNTYGNSCQAKNAGVDVSHKGECPNKCASNDQCESGTVCRDGLCQKPCEVQCIAPDPVCGVDGNTYMCGKADAACHGVDVAYEGKCEVVCPKVYDPVCGTDGITYGNSCEAKKAGAQIAHKGECKARLSTGG